MTPRQVADLGVARLGLPVPTGKLVTIQALAAALADARTAGAFEAALLDWVSTRELESECLEGLCALVLAQGRAGLIPRIRSAIRHPSLASDHLLWLATGHPAVWPSWTGCHSGTVPKLLDLESELKALRAGNFIPLVFTHKLEKLEADSGKPFLRQWAFEFSQLQQRVSSVADGYFDYFMNENRGNAGVFVGRKGHLARSAYLRALACAVESWGMPSEYADHYALQALPAEPLFLKLAPATPPSWASSLHEFSPDAADTGEALVRSALQQVEAGGERRVMHLSAAVCDSPLCHVELTVFTAVRAEPIDDAQHVLGFYNFLLGKITPNRDGLRAFVCPALDTREMEALDFRPTVVPLIGPMVGYLQADFVGRIPYLPISTQSLPQVEATPAFGGAKLTSAQMPIGEFACWYRNWQPSHGKDWPTPIACCTTLSHAAANAITSDLGGTLQQVWKLVTWTRQSDYSEWSSTEQVGVVAS
jgi:hypothetical protein